MPLVQLPRRVPARALSLRHRASPFRRLLTLEDTVEFFDLVLGTQLTTQEKSALVAYLRQL